MTSRTNSEAPDRFARYITGVSSQITRHYQKGGPYTEDAFKGLADVLTYLMSLLALLGIIGNADEMHHRRREFEKTRGAMQQAGTRSAHLSIQSMNDREHRWMQDELYRASNKILTEARNHGCTHIAFENLTGIRDRMAGAKRFHTWAFRRLSQYIEYKAEMFGIEVK